MPVYPRVLNNQNCMVGRRIRYLLIFSPKNRTLHISVSEHPPPHPRQRDTLTKKDASNLGRDVRESIAHTPHHDIFEGRGLLDKGWLVVAREEVSLVDEL